MNPTIHTTYHAMSKSGRIVQSFDSPALLHAFIARQKAQGVTMLPYEETRVMKPCPKRSRGGAVVKLADRRRG